MTDRLVEQLALTAVFLVTGGLMLAVLSGAMATPAAPAAGRARAKSRALARRHPGLRARVGKWTRHDL